MVEHLSRNLLPMSLYRIKTGSRNGYFCINLVLFFTRASIFPTYHTYVTIFESK